MKRLRTVTGRPLSGDLICLYLTFESSLSSGDTAKTQTFNVYEVTKRLYVDSIYYLNHFDVREVIDPEPLLTFDYKLGDGTNITKRMTSDKAVALMNRLLKATTEMYEDDSLFVNEYKGIYVAPADNSSARCRRTFHADHFGFDAGICA